MLTPLELDSIVWEPGKVGVLRSRDARRADAKARGDHLDTGALATKLILPVLTATGHADEAWAIATQVTFPSWGFWRANGATSLWEHWKLASRSRGHYFLGTVDDWLFEDVAGLRPLAPGPDVRAVGERRPADHRPGPPVRQDARVGFTLRFGFRPTRDHRPPYESC